MMVGPLPLGPRARMRRIAGPQGRSGGKFVVRALLRLSKHIELKFETHVARQTFVDRARAVHLEAACIPGTPGPAALFPKHRVHYGPGPVACVSAAACKRVGRHPGWARESLPGGIRAQREAGFYFHQRVRDPEAMQHEEQQRPTRLGVCAASDGHGDALGEKGRFQRGYGAGPHVHGFVGVDGWRTHPPCRALAMGRPGYREAPDAGVRPYECLKAAPGAMTPALTALLALGDSRDSDTQTVLQNVPSAAFRTTTGCTRCAPSGLEGHPAKGREGSARLPGANPRHWGYCWRRQKHDSGLSVGFVASWGVRGRPRDGVGDGAQAEFAGGHFRAGEKRHAPWRVQDMGKPWGGGGLPG